MIVFMSFFLHSFTSFSKTILFKSLYNTLRILFTKKIMYTRIWPITIVTVLNWKGPGRHVHISLSPLSWRCCKENLKKFYLFYNFTILSVFYNPNNYWIKLLDSQNFSSLIKKNLFLLTKDTEIVNYNKIWSLTRS